MAGQIGGRPYWEIQFDQAGRLGDDGGLRGELPGAGLSELFVFCHGWNATQTSARDLSRAMITLLAAQAGTFAPTRAVGFVAVFWPSLLFPDDDPQTAPAAPSSGAALAAALVPAMPDHAAALTRIGELLDAQPAGPEPLQECLTLTRGLITSPDLGALEDTGERVALEQPAAATASLLAGMSTSIGTAEAWTDPLTALWHGVRDALRVASYFEMKMRAGVIGQAALGPLLDRLAPTGQGPRVHLLGHSFGARLISFALAGLPPDRVGPASPVKSLTLIQGAFSHFSFAAPLPIDSTRQGHLAIERVRVDGPLLATHSGADRALGLWYPGASLLSRVDDSLTAADPLADLSYRWGAMGHDGYQQADAIALELRPEGHPYPFSKAQCYRLRSDDIIAADQSPFAGAHSDIRHPQITWASWAAALS